MTASALDIWAVQLVAVSKRFGDFTAVDRVSLQIDDGEFFSLLGPSGCGKTTTLRMIAGFEQPSDGEIFIKGERVSAIPPHHRPVNTVFQSYALFPHMDVAQNVAFGLEMKRTPRQEIKRRVEAALALVHLPGFEKRRPAQLSGGQQQRVALARALVNRPQVLLLDEPLGALDLKLRKAMQWELKQIQAEVGITFIYVTHDQEEALTMSDRIAVMNEGRIQQIGAPREIYEQPVNRFVADFIGETNFVPGLVVGLDEWVKVKVGELVLSASPNEQPLQVGQKVTLAIRPEKIGLYGANGALPGGEKEEDALRGRVEEVVYIGTDTRYRVQIAGQISLIVRQQNAGQTAQLFQPGDEALVHWPARHTQALIE